MSYSKEKLFSGLALLAVLFFLGVIGLQVAELMHYRAEEPSVWVDTDIGLQP